MRFMVPILCAMAIFMVPPILSPSPALAGASIAGCPAFPADNVWNTPVDRLPVDPNSAAYITTIGPDKGIHPDFGSGTWDGGPIGIPYNVVPGTQPKVKITFDYGDESDPGPYPIPPNPAIEGGSGSTGDRHILVLDKDNCILYETYSAYPQPDGSWQAGSGAIFDLRSNVLRPQGWTSADAAGLPILPGLVRYEEIAAGEIRHAIRFTAPQTRKAFIWPARHYASSLTASNYPPMGQRFRLKADFDTSGFSPEVQVILRALKIYGMILADNGSSWFISGVPDARWNDDLLVSELRMVKGSDFEAVNESSLMVSPDSGQAKQDSSDTQPPTVPSGLGAAAVSPSQIDLSWTASTDNVGVAGYVIYRNGAQIATTVNTSYQNSGLSPSTTYIYRVTAYDAAGNLSGPSNEASATTPAGPDTQAPTVPTGLNVKVLSSSQIQLSWSASKDNVGVTGYRIYRNGAQAGTSSGPFYQDSNLAPFTSYTYRVSAYDAAGNVSAKSASVTGKTYKFSINDRVRTTAKVTIRSTPSPSGASLGNQRAGARGTVVGGPVDAGGYRWWQVNFDSGPDGWVKEGSLKR